MKTELAAGLKKSALSGQVEPEDVADGHRRSHCSKPKLEVSVPGHLAVMTRTIRFFPHGVAEAFFKIGDQGNLLASAAHSPARDAYEARTVESAPGLSEH